MDGAPSSPCVSDSSSPAIGASPPGWEPQNARLRRTPPRLPPALIPAHRARTVGQGAGIPCRRQSEQGGGVLNKRRENGPTFSSFCSVSIVVGPDDAPGWCARARHTRRGGVQPRGAVGGRAWCREPGCVRLVRAHHPWLRVAKPPRSGDLSHSRCHVLHRLQSSVMSASKYSRAMRVLARRLSADSGGAALSADSGGAAAKVGARGNNASARAVGGTYVFARCAAFDCIHLAGRVNATNRLWSQRHPLKKVECTKHALAIPASRYVERAPHHYVTTTSPSSPPHPSVIFRRF